MMILNHHNYLCWGDYLMDSTYVFFHHATPPCGEYFWHVFQPHEANLRESLESYPPTLDLPLFLHSMTFAARKWYPARRILYTYTIIHSLQGVQYNHTMWLIFGMIHGFTVYKHSQWYELAKFGLFIWDFVFLGIGLRLSLPRIRHSDSCVLDIQSYLLMFSILGGFKWHFVFGGVLRWEGKSASNLSNIIKYICINFDLLPKMGSHFSWCLAAPLPPHILRP